MNPIRALSRELAAVPALSLWAEIVPSGPTGDEPLLVLHLDRLPKAARSRSFAALLRHAPFVHWPADMPVRVMRGKTNCFAKNMTLGYWRGTVATERDTASVRFERAPTALQEAHKTPVDPVAGLGQPAPPDRPSAALLDDLQFSTKSVEIKGRENESGTSASLRDEAINKC